MGACRNQINAAAHVSHSHRGDEVDGHLVFEHEGERRRALTSPRKGMTPQMGTAQDAGTPATGVAPQGAVRGEAALAMTASSRLKASMTLKSTSSKGK